MERSREFIEPPRPVSVSGLFVRFIILVSVFFVAKAYAGTDWAILSCFFLLSSFALARRSCDLFNPRRITIGSFWYITFLAIIYVPAFIVFSDQVPPYRNSFLLAVETVLITVPMGWWIVSHCLDFSPIETDVFFLRPVAPLNELTSFSQKYGAVLVVTMAITVLYLRTVAVVPLFYLFRHPGESLELALLREDSLKLLNSRFVYAFYMLRGVLYPLLIALALAVYLSCRQVKWLKIFAIVLCMGVFYAALSLAKSPVAAIFLILSFLYYYHRKGVPSQKIVAIFLILIVAFPIAVVMGAYATLDTGIQDAALALGYRLFYIPAETVYFYFEVFPKECGYLHGRSIGKLAWFLGMAPEDLTQSVSQYSSPDGLQTGTANAAFVANWHADFGLAGVLVGGVLTGALMQAVHVALVRRGKNPIIIATYAFLVFSFWLLHSTSLPIVLLSDGAIPALLRMWFFGGRDIQYRVPGTQAS